MRFCLKPGLVGRLFLVTTELRLLPYPDQGHTLCRVMFLSENGRFLDVSSAVSKMSFAEGDCTSSPGCPPSVQRTSDRQLSVKLCTMRHATRELLRTHLHGAADSSAVSESGRGERFGHCPQVRQTVLRARAADS